MARDTGPKFGGGKFKRGSKALPETSATEDIIDQLELFQEFQKEVLPMLQKDIKSGLSSKDLRKKYQSLLTARILTIALTDADSGKALAAAKDLVDREEGRATERHEQTHKFSDLKDDQLNALLLSKLKGKSDKEDQAN